MRRFIHRPSPALAVALLALFIALGSTGYAANQSAKPDHASAKAANSKKGPRGFRGFRGRRGFKGPAGAAGAAGPAGAAGAAGSALAYAHLTGGALDAANSKNMVITGLTPDGFSTCLRVTSGTPHNVVAMVDNSGADPRSTSVEGTVAPSAVASNCPAGSNVLITTVNTGSGVAVFTPLPAYVTIN